MRAIVKSIDEEFDLQKARTTGAKDKVPRKKFKSLYSGADYYDFLKESKKRGKSTAEANTAWEKWHAGKIQKAQSRVKQFTRTRRGKLESVSPFTREFTPRDRGPYSVEGLSGQTYEIPMTTKEYVKSVGTQVREVGDFHMLKVGRPTNPKRSFAYGEITVNAAESTKALTLAAVAEHFEKQGWKEESIGGLMWPTHIKMSKGNALIAIGGLGMKDYPVQKNSDGTLTAGVYIYPQK